jgi:formylglycine-generating enzyme required for sulfatase activity
MTPDRQPRVDELFDAALALTADQWPAFLAEACADAPMVRAEVEPLLACHARAEAAGFLRKSGYDPACLLDLDDSSPHVFQELEAAGGYEILGELGRGGMGVVYKAQHRNLHRLVALKVIQAGAQARPEDRGRFHTEAEAAARLQHPNVVQIFEVGEQDGCPYLALEYVEGGRLAQQLAGTPLPADPTTLVGRLATESDVGARRALVLALGEYPLDRLAAADQKSLSDGLLLAYRNDPDPGFHSAAEWCLRRWGQGADLKRVDQELVSAQPPHLRRWYVNRQGHTMAVFPGPVPYLMSTPANQPEHGEGEIQHRRLIPRSFAIATKEVTLGQFQRFWRAKYGNTWMQAGAGNPRPDPDEPVVRVTWFEAAAYCRWLSEQEQIPPAQMCYPPVEQIKEGLRPDPDYLSKTGYRLPTEAEWEYACRAGSTTARFYGSTDEMLGSYGWYWDNSQDRPHPVGLLKPNDFGMFDTYGNAWEWLQERGRSWYASFLCWQVVGDKEDTAPVSNLERRALRGGAFDSPRRTNLRSASRWWGQPQERGEMSGLRVARTLR